jgi:hypothetical protein
MQAAAECVVVAVGLVVRFRMRVGSRPDILKVALCQRRFELWQSARSARRRGGFTRTQQERGESGAEKKKIVSVTQRRRY